jgi:hypothetical protein
MGRKWLMKRPLTIEEILAWATAHREATDRRPTMDSCRIDRGGPSTVADALRRRRGAAILFSFSPGREFLEIPLLRRILARRVK